MVVLLRLHIAATSALQICARYIILERLVLCQSSACELLLMVYRFWVVNIHLFPQGLVMDHIRASSSRKDQVLTRFIYLGDGGGDFCPTLKLRECDCVMPRTNYPLWKRISDKSSLIKADVKEWSSAEELQRILMQLVSTMTKEDS